MYAATGSAGFEIPVLGEHQVVLALEAAAAARELGISIEESAAARREFEPPPMRLAVEMAGGVVVVNDAYNASPASMRAALVLLSSRTRGSRSASSTRSRGRLPDSPASRRVSTPRLASPHQG